MNYCYCLTPCGSLILEEQDNALTNIYLAQNAAPKGQEQTSPLLKQTILELKEYFIGKRQCFDLPLAVQGTPFQQMVWAELSKIPYGCTSCYSQIAEKIGCRGGARAVGNACNKNPWLIIIPCHRIIGKNKNLTGYAAGLEMKAYLLTLEAKIANTL